MDLFSVVTNKLARAVANADDSIGMSLEEVTSAGGSVDSSGETVHLSKKMENYIGEQEGNKINKYIELGWVICIFLCAVVACYEIFNIYDMTHNARTNYQEMKSTISIAA